MSSFFEYPTEREDGQPQLVFLPRLSDEDWRKFLAYTETQRFRRGDIVLDEDERDRALLIITEGTVTVLATTGRRRRPIATLDSGSLIGEVSFFDGEPRSTRVLAATNVEVIRLSYDAYEVLSSKEPDLARAILLDLGRVLAARFRRLSQIVAAPAD